jgi:hypothetical protein
MTDISDDKLILKPKKGRKPKKTLNVETQIEKPKEQEDPNPDEELQFELETETEAPPTPPPPKVKKPRSEKQMASFKKAAEKRMEKIILMRAQKEQEKEEFNKVKEQKLVEKALQIKRRQLKELKVIETADTKPPPQPPVVVNPYVEFKKKFNVR